MPTKNYYLVIDTETANGLDEPLTYDIGFAVTDKKGNIYETFSYIVSEVFYGMRDVMQSAYYATKIPKYEEDIANGKRVVAPFAVIKAKVIEMLNKYQITAVIAHNARFDVTALNITQRYLTKSKYRYFFPYGTQIWDSLAMARTTIGRQPTYKMWCKERGYITRNGMPKLTAEVLYRFITQDETFDESHTALEDVLIELLIFVRCVRQRKKMQRTYWKIVNG
jgi:DNA polymerase III epsilon subunit-like protein